MVEPRGRSRVLVVEDEESIRDLLLFHLDLAGYDSTAVADGKDALARPSTEPFDVIVLDVVLPGLDGVTLGRALRNEGPNREVPIMMLTARREESDTVLGLESSADDCLTKPFSVREFLARISALMRRPRSTWRIPGGRSTVSLLGVTIDPTRRRVTFVDRREVGGIVTLVAREGKVVDVHAVGFQDIEAKTPMRPDTIFRIASMTKPITSVAVMMLYEDGKLLLTDPVSKYIPSFKNQRVISNGEGGAAPVAARREMTIRDLLTHRSGLTYSFLNGGTVGNAYRQAGISDGLTVTPGTIGDNVDKLAAAPLVSHPGTAWNYGLSTDVLGRLVEVVSGTTFDVFLRDRIFKPLGMNDTSFDVPDQKWARLATVYSPDGSGGIRPMKDPETFGNTVMSPIAYYKAPKRYFSGGAGLTSTAHDYARFAQMLLNGGELAGVRLLSPKSIELMSSSHTADLPPGAVFGGSDEFGLGFRVVTDLGASQTLGSEGIFGWSGIYGTTFWVDPKERLVAVVMVQRYPGSTVAAAFQPLVYRALTRSAKPRMR
jgi:CubicO group peptidase (beta-lactamase class C family)